MLTAEFNTQSVKIEIIYPNILGTTGSQSLHFKLAVMSMWFWSCFLGESKSISGHDLWYTWPKKTYYLTLISIFLIPQMKFHE